MVTRDQANPVFDEIDAIQIVLDARTLGIPVPPIVIGMEDPSTRADDPSVSAPKAQMKQLRVRAAVLLAPALASISGRQDQTVIADYVPVVFVCELHRVEIEDPAVLLILAIAQGVVAAAKAVARIGAAQDVTLIAPHPNAVALYGDVIQANVDARRNAHESASIVPGTSDQPFCADNPDIVTIINHRIDDGGLIVLPDNRQLRPALLGPDSSRQQSEGDEANNSDPYRDTPAHSLSPPCVKPHPTA